MTMQLCGIAPKQSRASLLNFTNKFFPGAIDFLYVPRAADGTGNAGHAFLNFRSLPHLQHFIAFSPGYNRRVGTIVVANVLELDQALNDFRKSVQDGTNTTDSNWHPVLIDFQGSHRALPNGKGLSANAPTFNSVAVSVDQNRAALKTQVEFYFSEDNLIKDVFLRSRMDKDGWASIELIASFPQVKKFLPSVQDILDLLVTSESVEVDEKGSRMRAKDEKLRNMQIVK